MAAVNGWPYQAGSWTSRIPDLFQFLNLLASEEGLFWGIVPPRCPI